MTKQQIKQLERLCGIKERIYWKLIKWADNYVRWCEREN